EGTVNLGDYLEDSDVPHDHKRYVREQIKKLFTIYAVTGNWDAIGMPGRENILIIPGKGKTKPKLVLIDQGAALQYTGSGSLKNPPLTEKVSEIDSMRSASEATEGFEYFGDVKNKEIAQQVAQLPDDVGDIGDPEMQAL